MKSGRVVWVTGAVGFIGSHLSESLLHAGYSVVGIDNFDAFYSRHHKESNLQAIRKTAEQTRGAFQFREFDICNLQPDSLHDLPPPSQIIHLAAKAGVRDRSSPWEFYHVNLGGTLRVLEYCRIHGINELIFGSSSSVYGNSQLPFSEDQTADRPVSLYAATKRAGELLCATYAHLHGIKIAALRFFTVYGPRQRPDLAIHKFVQQLSNNKPVTIFGDGSSARDYTFITDIVKGIHLASRWLENQKPGSFEVYNLGSSKIVSLKELVDLIERQLQLKATIQIELKQPGDVEQTLADISKSRQVFGYIPQVTMSEGIREFVEWFQKKEQRL